ncbi:MAG TPA: ferritin-like domain-containing protein [Gaiellaceae bacterium]|nr:ferritin-like domain-containing protein [Gaiellaceae bacterium]
MPALARSAAPDLDLAWLRLLTAAELLAIDFYGRTAATAAIPARQLLADERAHYHALAQLLTRAGATPATAADIDFSYPRRPHAELALRIERLMLGAYVGAAVSLQTPELRLAVTQVAANEAQHVAVWSRLEGRGPVGPAFAPALTIAAASNALAEFES